MIETDTNSKAPSTSTDVFLVAGFESKTAYGFYCPSPWLPTSSCWIAGSVVMSARTRPGGAVALVSSIVRHSRDDMSNTLKALFIITIFSISRILLRLASSKRSCLGWLVIWLDGKIRDVLVWRPQSLRRLFVERCAILLRNSQRRPVIFDTLISWMPGHQPCTVL